MRRIALPIVALLLTVQGLQAQSGYTFDHFSTQDSVPVRIAFPPDGTGRLFYLELFNGNVKVISSDSTQSGTWLRVNSDPLLERGLLGIAFDSNFTSNHYVYIYYTFQSDTPANRVERYTEVNYKADTTSRMLLFQQSVATPCGIASNHNGGALTFGSDGKLYITLGENACSDLSTLTTDPRGKVLRIEPHIPAPNNAVTSNPFYDDGNPFTGNDDRIFAKGLRNAFGMTLSPFDNTVYVTENGPDCNDEVNRILSGHDYGWRPECFSGLNHCSCSQDSPYTRPLLTISPPIAPTGILFYDGTVYPELYGKALFADNNQGYIHVGILNGTHDSLIISDVIQPGVGSIYDIIKGPDGYIYFCFYDGICRMIPKPNEVNDDAVIPTTYLLQNVPNPFNPLTNIQYAIATREYVRLAVYNILGEEIAVLADGIQEAGIKSYIWHPVNMPSGVYFYRLRAGEFREGKKMLLLK
jgi:glucose/arabinose dehydrogenase